MGRLPAHCMSVAEVAVLLGVSRRTVYNWRAAGYGPPIKGGRYYRLDVERWVTEHHACSPRDRRVRPLDVPHQHTGRDCDVCKAA